MFLVNKIASLSQSCCLSLSALQFPHLGVGDSSEDAGGGPLQLDPAHALQVVGRMNTLVLPTPCSNAPLKHF